MIDKLKTKSKSLVNRVRKNKIVGNIEDIEQESVINPIKKAKSNFTFTDFLIEAQKHAAKAALLSFIGLIYVLVLVGAIQPHQMITFVIDLSFFIIISVITAYTVWYSRKSSEKMTEMQAETVLMNKKHKEQMEDLVNENMRAEHHFYDMLGHYDSMVDFASLIYSEEKHEVISVNKYFEHTFGFSVQDLNSKLTDLMYNESMVKIIDLLSFEQDKVFNDQKMLNFTHSEDKDEELEIYLYRRVNSHFSVCPFKVAFFDLPYAKEKSFQLIFVDLTIKKNIDELLKMHYQTILTYTKELLRRDMEDASAEALIQATIEYQKNKRIKLIPINEGS